jgi:hypothetical protein
VLGRELWLVDSIVANVGASLPLLLVTYSDQVERLMYVSWVFNYSHANHILKLEIFGRDRDAQSSCHGNIVRIPPLELGTASTALAEIAQFRSATGTAQIQSYYFKTK